MNNGNEWKGEWERVSVVEQDIGVAGCNVIYVSIVGASLFADD